MAAWGRGRGRGDTSPGAAAYFADDTDPGRHRDRNQRGAAVERKRVDFADTGRKHDLGQARASRERSPAEHCEAEHRVAELIRVLVHRESDGLQAGAAIECIGADLCHAGRDGQVGYAWFNDPPTSHRKRKTRRTYVCGVG